MNRRDAIKMGLLLTGYGVLARPEFAAAQAGGFTTLFDGRNLDNFDQTGNANWRIIDGAVQADRGNGFLVSKQSYKDFIIRVEVWVDTPANSGVFIRAQNPQNIGANSAYECNIFDTRPDPSYGTGAIVNVAKVDPMPKAANNWNTMEIEARGPNMQITFNGKVTSKGSEGSKPQGRFALQYGGGLVKFRKVEIRTL